MGTAATEVFTVGINSAADLLLDALTGEESQASAADMDGFFALLADPPQSEQ